jgi:hypothetical protein
MSNRYITNKDEKKERKQMDKENIDTRCRLFIHVENY